MPRTPITTSYSSRNAITTDYSLSRNNCMNVIITGFWNDSKLWEDDKIWYDEGNNTSYIKRPIITTNYV